MRKWMAALIFSAVPAGGGAAWDGPMRASNLAPVHLLLLQPPAEGPCTMGRGTLGFGLDLAYATVHISDASGRSSALLDMESARAGFRLGYGLGFSTEVGVETALLWMGGGIFDQALIGYHRTFGFPGGGRQDAPRNRFAYAITREEETYSPHPRWAGLGDTVVRCKQALWAPSGSPARLSLRGLLKLPTGSVENGFGSGSVDGSVGLVFGARRGAFGFYGNMDAVYVGGSPSPVLRLGTHWAASAMGAVTAQAWSLGELGLQLRYFATPYRTGLEPLDKDVWMLAAGFRRPFLDGAAAWSIAFAEDPAVQSSPDFTILASVEWVLRSGR